MVDIVRLLFVAGIFRAAAAALLFTAFFLSRFKVVITPYAIDTLEVDIPSVFSKLYRYTPIAKPRTLFYLLFYRIKYSNILERYHKFIPLGTPRLLKSFTCLTLGYAQLITGGLY